MIEYNDVLERFKLLVTTNRSVPSPTYIEEVLPQCGFTKDTEVPGVYYKVIGTPTVIYTAHYDTAGDSDVELMAFAQLPHVVTNKNPGILGADDKAGLTVLSFMIEANIPGLYLLFGDEESGAGQSRRWAATDFYTRYSLEKDSIVSAIAFDRRGYSDTIQTQRGGTCCSKEYAGALSTVLAMGGLSYRPTSGVYTDTANMIYVIPECTNLSIGYAEAHGSSENQDVLFLFRMVNFMLTNHEAVSNIPKGKEVEKKPIYTPAPTSKWGTQTTGNSRFWAGHSSSTTGGIQIYDEYTQSWVDDTDSSYYSGIAPKRKAISIGAKNTRYPEMKDNVVSISESSVIGGYIYELIEDRSTEYAKSSLMSPVIYDSLGIIYLTPETVDLFVEDLLETIYASNTSVDVMYRGQMLRLLSSMYDITDHKGYLYIILVNSTSGYSTVTYDKGLGEYNYEDLYARAAKNEAVDGTTDSLFKTVDEEKGETISINAEKNDFIL